MGGVCVRDSMCVKDSVSVLGGALWCGVVGWRGCYPVTYPKVSPISLSTI